MVSTQLKNISQNGNLPQVGVEIKHIWNHHLVKYIDQPNVRQIYQPIRWEKLFPKSDDWTMDHDLHDGFWVMIDWCFASWSSFAEIPLLLFPKLHRQYRFVLGSPSMLAAIDEEKRWIGGHIQPASGAACYMFQSGRKRCWTIDQVLSFRLTLSETNMFAPGRSTCVHLPFKVCNFI